MSKLPNPFRIMLLFEHSLLTLFTVNDVQLQFSNWNFVLFCFAFLTIYRAGVTPDFCFPGAAKDFLGFEIGDFGSFVKKIYASICWGQFDFTREFFLFKNGKIRGKKGKN